MDAPFPTERQVMGLKMGYLQAVALFQVPEQPVLAAHVCRHFVDHVDVVGASIKITGQDASRRAADVQRRRFWYLVPELAQIPPNIFRLGFSHEPPLE